MPEEPDQRSLLEENLIKKFHRSLRDALIRILRDSAKEVKNKRKSGNK